MENKLKSSSLENFLFSFTRVLAIGGSVLALIIIAVLVSGLFDSGKNTYVALEDINVEESTKNNTIEEASAPPKVQLFIPENIKAYLSGDNEKILQGWLDGIKGQEKKQDFLENMSEVITKAETNKLEVVNVINNYKTLKLSKLNRSEIEEYKDIGQKVALYAVIFGLIIFIALMSLILVMLAIERNTRQV